MGKIKIMNKLIITFFTLLLIACEKQETCNQINGTWKLTRLMSKGEVVCEYDNSFYYTYTFNNSKVVSTQYRNGIDSFVSNSNVDCNNVFNVTADSFYYGNIIDYGVLVK